MYSWTEKRKKERKEENKKIKKREKDVTIKVLKDQTGFNFEISFWLF